MAITNFTRRPRGNVGDLNYLKKEKQLNNPIGVMYPFNNNNGIFYKSYTNYEQVLTNLKILLLTTKGERYLQPEFGTDLKRLLFENISNEEEFKEKVSGTITTAINRWLLYLTIIKCQVKFNIDDAGNTIDASNTINIELEVNIAGTPINLPIRIFISDTGTLRLESAIYPNTQSSY